MSLNQHVGHRGFFWQVSGFFFGKVHSIVAVKTPGRAAQALCGTVWQLLYIRTKLHRMYQAALVPTTRPPPAPLKAEARDTDTEGRRTRNTPAIAGSAQSMAHAVVI